MLQTRHPSSSMTFASPRRTLIKRVSWAIVSRLWAHWSVENDLARGFPGLHTNCSPRPTPCPVLVRIKVSGKTASFKPCHDEIVLHCVGDSELRRGTTKTFQESLRGIDTITNLELSHSAVGEKPMWSVANVVLTQCRGENSFGFSANGFVSCWDPERRLLSKLLEPESWQLHQDDRVCYHFVVATSDIPHASTELQVFMRLLGTGASSKAIALPCRGDDSPGSEGRSGEMLHAGMHLEFDVSMPCVNRTCRCADPNVALSPSSVGTSTPVSPRGDFQATS